MPSRFSVTRLLVWLLVPVLILPVLSTVWLALDVSGKTFIHLQQTVLSGYLWQSFALAASVGLICLVIGSCLAWLVNFYEFPARRFWQAAVVTPLAIPAYIAAIAFGSLFEAGSVIHALLGPYTPQIRSFSGAVLVLSLVQYPYVYLLARTAFGAHSRGLVEIGQLHGRSPLQVFLQILLPASRPAIIAGVALVMLETLGDFGAVSLFGVDTLTTGIYRTWFGMYDIGSAAALAMLLLVVVITMLIVERTMRRQARYYQRNCDTRPIMRRQLRGWRAGLAVTGCAIPFLLGAVIPVVVLLAWAFQGEKSWEAARAGRALVNSGAVAVLAGVLIMGMALLFGYVMRFGRHRPTAILAQLPAMGYAVPGVVIAIGTLVPLTAFDHLLDQAMRGVFGVSTGLLLTGSLAALFFAYMVRFLAVGLGAAEGSYSKISPEMEWSGRLLGLTGWQTVRNVHLPILHRGLLAGMLLVMVEVIKELPATLIMRPFGFDTLAVRAYELASDERLRDAAWPALCIILLALLPMLGFERLVKRHTSEPVSLTGSDSCHAA